MQWDRNITEGQFILRSGKICLRITHVLFQPIPVYRQTRDFIPKQVAVSRLHGTVVKFHTGVKILTSGQQLGWTQASVTHMGMTFCGCII